MKTIVITGTGRGIGKAIAEALLLEKDIRVVGISRGETATVEKLLHIPFDLAVLEEIPVLWRQISALPGSVTTLILNAGCGHIERFIDEDAESIAKVLDINFASPYLLAREAVSYWQQQRGRGHIIFIGSQAGLPGKGQAFNSLYSASKAALHSLVGSLSRELGPAIRVNAVAPGDVVTKLAQESAESFVELSPVHHSTEEYHRIISERSSLKRWVRPEELVSSVRYLMENTALTGTILNVSAGSTVY
ncbi:MAG: SDR family oxidoreductase [bacterium]|nr:SDR family oxidoreductase [bacterium]